MDINYDWNVSFNLPSSWSFDAAEGAFISEQEYLEVKRIREFILPEFWENVETSTTSIKVINDDVMYYKEENEDIYYATVRDNIFTYIFTTTSTDRFTEEQQNIITSLNAL